MVLFILILLTLLFIFVNLVIASYDYLHPAVVFGVGFLFAEIMCVLGIETYAISLHEDLLLLFLAAYIAFTLANLLSYGVVQRGKKPINHFEALEVDNIWVGLTIFIQVVAVVSFIIYLRRLSVAYYGHVSTLPVMIKLYNNLTSFWTQTYSKMNVTIPMAYRVCNPIGDAAAYLLYYVAIENYVINRKIQIKYIISLLLLMGEMLLNSSRTPIMMLVLMGVMIFYVLNYRNGKSYVGSASFFAKLLLGAVALIVLCIYALKFIGRKLEMNLFNYIFIYTGAPLVNLDTTMQMEVQGSDVWGLYTFGKLYRYVFKLLGLDTSGLQVLSNTERFLTSANGLSTGNVGTCFWNYIEDFGLWGVFPLVLVMGIYYCIAYRKIMHRNYTEDFDFGLFIYSYLFVGVGMAFFAEEFYGKITDAPFIKVLIISFILKEIYFDGPRIKITYNHSRSKSEGK